eukprot:2166245-Lingulodinium_polyedra.AAC.1
MTWHPCFHTPLRPKNGKPATRAPGDAVDLLRDVDGPHNPQNNAPPLTNAGVMRTPTRWTHTDPNRGLSNACLCRTQRGFEPGFTATVTFTHRAWTGEKRGIAA